jgi:hypothetical protein
MLCNENVPDANSPINFKNDSFCPTCSRDFSTLGKCITVNDDLTYILDKESNKKKLNTPVKENFCKNLFQTPISNQNEGNDFENDEIQMEVCCPSGKEIPDNRYPICQNLTVSCPYLICVVESHENHPTISKKRR